MSAAYWVRVSGPTIVGNSGIFGASNTDHHLIEDPADVVYDEATDFLSVRTADLPEVPARKTADGGDYRARPARPGVTVKYLPGVVTKIVIGKTRGPREQG